MNNSILERSKILATSSTTFLTILLALTALSLNADIDSFIRIKGNLFFSAILGFSSLVLSLIPLSWNWVYEDKEKTFNIILLIASVLLVGTLLLIIISLHGLIYK